MRQDEQLRRRDPAKYHERTMKRLNANGLPLPASQHSGGAFHQFSIHTKPFNSSLPPSTAPVRTNSEKHVASTARGVPIPIFHNGRFDYRMHYPNSSPQPIIDEATPRISHKASITPLLPSNSERRQRHTSNSRGNQGLQLSQEYKKKRQNLLMGEDSGEAERSPKKRKTPHNVIDAGFKSGGQMETTFNNFLRQQLGREDDGSP